MIVKNVEISNAALVFTDAATGQGYLRRMTEWETKLVTAQLSALDDGEMKAFPVHPVQVRAMTPHEVAANVQDNPA